MQPITTYGATLGIAPTFQNRTQSVIIDDFQFADNAGLYPDEVDDSGGAARWDDTGTYANAQRMGVVVWPLNTVANINWTQSNSRYFLESMSYYRADWLQLISGVSAPAPVLNHAIGLGLSSTVIAPNPATNARRFGFMWTNTTASGLTAFQLQAVQSQTTPTFLTVEYSTPLAALYGQWVKLGIEYVAGAANPIRWYVNDALVAQAANTPNWITGSATKMSLSWSRSGGVDPAANVFALDYLREEYRCTR